MEMTVIDPIGDIAQIITASYSKSGRGAGDIVIRHVLSPGDLNGQPPDILVLSPDAVMTRRGQSAPVQCGILLLPGDADADSFDAGCVVTYGMSPKNTLTLSSIGEDTCVLALQRELLTANGAMLERQEFNINSGLQPDRLLAMAGALLTLGLKPSEINP